MPVTAAELILDFNRGREAERLSRKYAAMRQDAFQFLRGTCHLFHQRMSEHGLAPDGPRAWLCGDLHLENVGTYLGDNGLVYFDVSDFDEAALAPFAWDILRLATSVLAGGPEIGLKAAEAKGHANLLVETYFAELAAGKPRWLERRTVTGPVGDLIEDLKRRDQTKFLAKRTVTRGGRLTVLADGKRALEATDLDRRDLRSFLEAYVARTTGHPAMTMLDAGRRIAGTGSLGIARFVLLTEGAEGPDLLDLKAAAPSALGPYLPAGQPAFASEADRVVAIQTLFQANTPSLLSAQTFRGAPFVLKQLQPSADRLNLRKLTADQARFGQAVRDMARLTAWGHLRGTGRYGSATADDLIAAAHDSQTIQKAILDAAGVLAKINAEDWAQYAAAYDRGAFGKPLTDEVED